MTTTRPSTMEVLEQYRDEIINAYRCGRLQSEIAADYGCTQQAISTALLQWGAKARHERHAPRRDAAATTPPVKRRPKRYTPVSRYRDQCIQMWRAGKNYQEIADAIGASRWGVAKAMKRWRFDRSSLPLATEARDPHDFADLAAEQRKFMTAVNEALLAMREEIRELREGATPVPAARDHKPNGKFLGLF